MVTSVCLQPPARLVKNYEGWEKTILSPRSACSGSGHDDGMEYNINSRQTKDIVRGGPGYRPSFNAYMWADAQAIVRSPSCRRHQDGASNTAEGRDG